jgi:hypothetical protein|tara:strand:- start:15 stop:227 length:213 start_codon:yes stop_codon:yes gene_type:complete
MVGNVDKPESTVKPVTPMETGVELLEKPEILPHETRPHGSDVVPETLKLLKFVVERTLQVRIPLLATLET